MRMHPFAGWSVGTMAMTVLAVTLSVVRGDPAGGARAPDTGAPHPIRVACVGDSITMGVGTKVPAQESYPAQLQAMLGPRWEVQNFGVGGRTMLRKADPLAFGRALASQPDVVLIMLGTNDSKTNIWSVHKDEFAADYTAAAKAFLALPSRPKVWACLPVPAFPGNWGISETNIVEGVIPAIRQAAEAAGIPVLDVHTPLVDAKACFPDRVHPNREGAHRIAEVVAAALAGKPSGAK